MTTKELRTFWRAAPFVPFNILLPGGKKLSVPHPELLAISPSGRIVHVWQKNDDYTALDIQLITGLEQASVPKSKKSKRAHDDE